MFDPQHIHQDFPILQKTVHGKPLIYLDNAATSQKPTQVINAISNYYTTSNANVHRGVHQLSDESTTLWEESCTAIAKFFGAQRDELIMVRNTTEAINGVAYGWALDHLQTGDVILTTEMEHHSNLVVWQEICKRTGATLEFVKVTDEGTLDLENFKFQISNFKIKLLVLTHVSNTLGTVNPIESIMNILKIENCESKIVLDAAQSAPHLPIDFHGLGVDFLTFSGHKMLGPMGVGGLLVRKQLLKSNEFWPWLFGGGMIDAVYTDHTDFADTISDRFTAGTPDVAGAVGLAAACAYLSHLGMNNVAQHDQELVAYAIEQLRQIPEVKIVGPTESNFQFPISNSQKKLLPTGYDLLPRRVGSVAFLYDGVHPHDVAQILDSEGVAVRSGHHCTMPLHTKFNWPGTVRASFQIYNTKDDIDQLISALGKVKKVFV